jgi:hypothetical protein
MEGIEMPIRQKYGESKTTRIMMATVPHVTSEAGHTKFQAAGFLLNSVQRYTDMCLDLSILDPSLVVIKFNSQWAYYMLFTAVHTYKVCPESKATDFLGPSRRVREQSLWA